MDKSTLQHQLAALNGDLTAINSTLTERQKQLQQIATEIERLIGARDYHTLVTQRLQRDIAAIDAAGT